MADETEFLDTKDSDESPGVPRWNPKTDLEENQKAFSAQKKKTKEIVPPSSGKKSSGFGKKIMGGVKFLFSFLLLLVCLIFGYLFFPDSVSPDELIKQISYATAPISHSHEISVYPMVVGYYTLPKSFYQPIGEAKDDKLPILAFLIEHSEYGRILYNTGFAEGIEDRLKNHTWLLNNLKIEVTSNTKAELAKKGITPAQIDKIILGSLEWENADGLLDFPNAKVYVATKEFESAKSYSGVHPKYWKEHLNGSFEKFNFPLAGQDSAFLAFDQSLKVSKENLEGLEESLVLVSTPGATIGHCSLIVSFKTKKRLVLTGNAAWTKAHISAKEDLPRMGRKFLRYDSKKALKSICQFWFLQKEDSTIEFLCGHEPDLGNVKFPATVYQGE